MSKHKGGHNPTNSSGGLSRRKFMTTISTGAVVAAVTVGNIPQATAKEPEILKAGEMKQISLRINNRIHQVLVEPRWTLLYVLRETLELTGTKVGCERGECGACTVLIDNIPRYACLTLAVEAEGHDITTLEGLMKGEELGGTQQSFLEHDGYQCGYCTPGQIMAAEGLLRKNANPTFEEIRMGMSGNTCRCGAYPNIFESVKRAAESRRAK